MVNGIWLNAVLQPCVNMLHRMLLTGHKSQNIFLLRGGWLFVDLLGPRGSTMSQSPVKKPTTKPTPLRRKTYYIESKRMSQLKSKVVHSFQAWVSLPCPCLAQSFQNLLQVPIMVTRRNTCVGKSRTSRRGISLVQWSCIPFFFSVRWFLGPTFVPDQYQLL